MAMKDSFRRPKRHLSPARARLQEAIDEVTRTVLTNPAFFPADDMSAVEKWVRKLFADLPEETFRSLFAVSVRNPELPWGKKRFWIPAPAPEKDKTL